MNAEIITIGTELLLGDITDLNSVFLAQECKDLGIDVYHLQTVGDNPKRLQKALRLAQSRSDVVFAVGGLGPTADDITKDVLAELLGVPLVIDPPAHKKMREHFEKWDEQITPNNLKQVQVPAGSQALKNSIGLAVGVSSVLYNSRIFLLPGPPQEMQTMFLEEIKPRLQDLKKDGLFSHVYRFLGVGESQLDHALAPWMDSSNPSLAPYAGEGEVALRLTARASNEIAAEEIMAPVDAAIRKEFSWNLYGVDVDDVSSALHNFLLQKNLYLATAESCTGGMVAKALTDHAGSSKYFLGGIVSYSNAAKMELLRVPEKTLAHYGAVSPETALAMAQGAKEVFTSDIAISTTGVAGPEGGSPEKPVGTVYMGLVWSEGECVHKLMNLPQSYNSRAMIRLMTVKYSLFHTLKLLSS